MASSVAPGIVQQNDPKKLVEYLMGDLRLLSTEAKKKYNHIKEAAESGLVKVRNISSSASSSDNLLHSFRSLCTEIVHPFLLGCSSKNPRLVQISLQSIQKLLQFLAIDRNAVPGIVNELWALTEAECEELKVLQTITAFVSCELLVTDWALAKCIVLAFRLNFSKDSSVINAASAAVRHLFSTVFERAFQEDGMRGVGTEEMKILPQQKNLAANVQQSLAPPTLRPAAADAFLLLRDLCILIRRENPTWLIGIHKVTPILALELLESVVKFYPSIFFRHSEFTELLKGYICPQVIKLIVGEREISLSSSTTNGGVVPSSNSSGGGGGTQNRSLPISAALLTQQHHQQQQHGQIVTKARDFPIMIRSMRISLALLTNYHSILASQNELILSILLDLLCMPTNSWEAAVAIEVFRKIMAQPTLLKWLCARDEGGKFVELLFSRLTAFLRRCLEEAANDSPSVREDKVGGQQGFIFKGVFLPFDERQLSQKRSILLDWLDKHSAERIPEAYCLSVGFATLVDATGAVCSAVEGELLPDKGSTEGEGPVPEGQNNSTTPPAFDVAKELFQVAHPFLTSGLSTLLEFSVDDSVTEHLLNCLTSMITLACKLGNAEAKHSLLKAFCRAALPCQYFSRFVSSNVPAVSMQNISVSNGTAAGSPSLNDLSLKESSVEPTQVVAMGTVCPSPHHPSQYFNTTVMMTAKNLQVARLLINCVHVNAHLLGGCWEMVLTTIQHFVWIIGLRPTSMGTFRAGGETKPASEGGGIMSTTSTSAASTVILTTAASSELPDLNQQLNMLFESTSSLDEVSIHHIIAALCKLSNESMMVAQVSSRETSFFSVAKLLQTALVNLSRLHVFWRPVTAHLIELCGHSNIATREWGAVSLTQLVKSAMKQTLAEFRVTETNKKTPNVEEITKREQLILNPLAAINEIEYLDVRVKQLDCLMRILQADSRPIEAPLWSSVLQIVTSVVVPDSRMNTITDPQLIDQAFRVLSLVIKEFLTVVPFECVEMLVETDALYGQQQIHLNVALASVGQLWDISDFVRRAQQSVRKEEEEKAWLCIYAALGRLCVDARPPVRKSACDTLLQTVAAHGQALGTQRWAEMLTDVLFPMLDRVRHLTQTASTHRSNTSSLGAPNIMIHHSRDTESKQWAETSVKTLGGVVKIFNAQRPMLLQLGGFSDFWSQLLTHIELAAKADNAEMSLAALKNMQDLLFGRQQQTESSHQSTGVRGKQSMANVRTYTDLSVNPSLPEPLWLVCWSFWLRIAQAIVSPDCPATLDFVAPSPHTPSNESPFIPSTKKHFVPGLYHLTTLLEMFQQLFQRVRHQIPVEDVRSQRLSQIFQEIAAIPLANDPISISAHNTAEQLHPAQESLLNSIRLVIQEQIESNSPLRPALPDLLRLLLSFFQFAVQPPVNKFSAVFSAAPSSKVAPNTNVQCPPSQNMILFAEVSLKTALEFYTKTVAFDEVLQQTVLTDIVKRLAEPLSLKYRCPSQSTWQLSATTLIKACQVGFPIARENVNLFKGLWPAFAMAIENFLFSPSKSAHPLNADERKRHEFIDCLAIELIRTELLPYAATLPREFMQRIIDILNRGSINTMDSHDVLASDAYQQRADLSRVCFDSLLSLSQTDATTAATATTTRHHQQKSPTTSSSSGGGFLRNTNQTTAACSSLGATAIASLLQRCSKVLNDYAKDEQTAGHFRLPQERIFESISALQAITALIEGFSRNPNNPTLYSHLVTLHPSLVQLIPSSRGDHQVELALMTCLNSYQTLLLLNLHNK